MEELLCYQTDMLIWFSGIRSKEDISLWMSLDINSLEVIRVDEFNHESYRVKRDSPMFPYRGYRDNINSYERYLIKGKTR